MIATPELSPNSLSILDQEHLMIHEVKIDIENSIVFAACNIEAQVTCQRRIYKLFTSRTWNPPVGAVVTIR